MTSHRRPHKADAHDRAHINNLVFMLLLRNTSSKRNYLTVHLYFFIRVLQLNYSAKYVLHVFDRLQFHAMKLEIWFLLWSHYSSRRKNTKTCLHSHLRITFLARSAGRGPKRFCSSLEEKTEDSWCGNVSPHQWTSASPSVSTASEWS